MAFFYSDAREPFTGSVNFHKLNAVKGYLRHYANYLALSFMQAASKDRMEKAQLTKELSLCERKLEWWKRHPNYEQNAVTRGCAALKKQWGSKEA